MWYIKIHVGNKTIFCKIGYFLFEKLNIKYVNKPCVFRNHTYYSLFTSKCVYIEILGSS